MAIRQGATVYGAASMGALRAAELHSCGVQGFGKIYQMYRSGEIEADDEVAILHADGEDGWRPLSDALVNLRATFAHAAANAKMTDREHLMLIDIAATTPFGERRLQQLLSTAAELGQITKSRSDELFTTLAEAQINLKAQDAGQMLEHLATLRTEPAANFHVEAPRKPATVYEVLWREQTVAAVARMDGGGGDSSRHVSRWTALATAQVLALDYPEFHEWSLLLLAAAMGNPELAVGIAADPDLSGDDHAVHTRILDAARDALHTDDLNGVEPARLWRAATALAESSGWLGPSGPDPVRHRSWLTKQEWSTLSEQHRIARIVTRSLHWSPGLLPRPFLMAQLRMAGALDRLVTTAEEVQRFNDSLAAQGERYVASHLSHEKMMRWFLVRWSGQREPFAAAAAHGFTSTDTFAEAVTPFYPIDRLTDSVADYRMLAR